MVKDVISCPWAIFYGPKMNKIVNWESRINSKDLINKEYLTEVVVLKYETSREPFTAASGKKNVQLLQSVQTNYIWQMNSIAFGESSTPSRK